MFENGGVLKTWSLPHPPEASQKVACTALPDHRLAYLDYEGPVSKNRGSVTRWDHGTYDLVEATETMRLVKLHGKKLLGQATLTIAARPPEGDVIWTLLYTPTCTGT
jgi:hypothetical protein